MARPILLLLLALLVVTLLLFISLLFLCRKKEEHVMLLDNASIHKSPKETLKQLDKLEEDVQKIVKDNDITINKTDNDLAKSELLAIQRVALSEKI